MPATRIAILGSGIFAKEAHLPALAKLGDSVNIKAVYSRSSKSASGFAKDTQDALKLQSLPDIYHDEDTSVSLDVLFARSDVDAVIVVLPITVQPAIIIKALASGKHVLSEKPVAPDVIKGRALIQEYETKYKPKGLVWRVAENFEAEPGFQVARDIVREGQLGKIVSFNARAYNWIDESSKWYNTPWRTVPDYQGGFLLDGGVHTIAALRIILNSPFTTLSAHASLAKEILLPHDTINAIVGTAGGAYGIVEISWGSPVPSRAEDAHNSISVTGKDGWLNITRASGLIRVTVKTATRDEKGKITGESTRVIEKEESGVQLEIASFLEALGGLDDGLDGPRGTLVDVAFIEAALNSNGAPVDVSKLAAL